MTASEVVDFVLKTQALATKVGPPPEQSIAKTDQVRTRPDQTRAMQAMQTNRQNQADRRQTEDRLLRLTDW